MSKLKDGEVNFRKSADGGLIKYQQYLLPINKTKLVYHQLNESISCDKY